MSDASGMRISHIGLCVSDRVRSRRFYERAFGFRHLSDLDVDGELPSRLLRLKDVALHAVYLQRDGVTIELLEYTSPGHSDDVAPRVVNRLGLTHLSLNVDDLDALLPAIVETGGRVLDDTRIDPGGGVKAIFVVDPDGTPIELVQRPG
jgi:catechol 2,3-dioxygenase-like lactoylglutathione lyase family enzyme